MISLVKIKLTKDPSLIKKDARLEKVIRKYDEFLKSKEALRRESFHDKNTQLLETHDHTPDENYQLRFMKEVLYNYLDKELKIRRED